MKLDGEQVPEHVGLPKPQTEADDSERPGEADHAKLIDEVAVGLIVRMVGRARMIVGRGMSMAVVMSVIVCV